MRCRQKMRASELHAVGAIILQTTLIESRYSKCSQYPVRYDPLRFILCFGVSRPSNSVSEAAEQRDRVDADH